MSNSNIDLQLIELQKILRLKDKIAKANLKIDSKIKKLKKLGFNAINDAELLDDMLADNDDVHLSLHLLEEKLVVACESLTDAGESHE